MCTVDSPDEAGDEAVVELSSCCCCLNMEPVLDMSRGASGAAPCPDAGLMECEGMTGACGSWLFDVEEED